MPAKVASIGNGYLVASLDALNLGFAQFRASWFSRFHESLKPTPDERAARTERYLALLASPLGPTVSFALAALKIVQRVGKLDAGAVLARIEPAIFAKTAASAKGALALLANSARSATSSTPRSHASPPLALSTRVVRCRRPRWRCLRPVPLPWAEMPATP